MAESEIKKTEQKKSRKMESYDSIDPIYQKYTKSVIRALSSTEFYDFFMDAISRAQNEFQFSNRKLVKTVDVRWVDAIEETLQAMQVIIDNPRNVIREEELIVNVANARKIGSDVVRHLSQHSSLVENYDYETGDVRPSKLMQKLRDDSNDLYENRLVFTVMESAYHFVKIRYDALFDAMSDEFGAKLKMTSDMYSGTEKVHMDMFLHIKENDSMLKTDEKNQDVFSRIDRLYRVLRMYMGTNFAQQMSKLNRVKGAVVKTNVLKKNPNYRKIAKLWDFLREYNEIGYMIRVVEQNPKIEETFQRDIYHSIMFNYIILKGYLEDEKDRLLPEPVKEKRRVLKPKFIHQIIEELTEDYDLPDVEVRKVLIEELTKAQLMQEEAEERRRLVEEQEKRRKEEAERVKREKEAEKERIRREKEAERERIRQEKEAEKARLLQEQMEREMEDRRRGDLFRAELEYFRSQLKERLEAREEEKARALEEKQRQDYAEAARLLEEEEQRRKEEAARERKRKEEERARLKREKEEAELRARREAEEEAERIRLEAERLQIEQDLEALKEYREELDRFAFALASQLKLRADMIEAVRKAKEQAEKERQLRREKKRTVFGR